RVAGAERSRCRPESQAWLGIEGCFRTITGGVYQTRFKTRRNGGFSDSCECKKKIRAAHAKEKQQIQSTCGYPNRLNLPHLTAGFSGPFENSRVFMKKFWLL